MDTMEVERPILKILLQKQIVTTDLTESHLLLLNKSGF